MLFHPRKPILGIQGLLPKRRQMLAEKISDAATRILPDSVRKLENIPILGPTIISEFKKTVEAQVNNLSLKELEDIINARLAPDAEKFITMSEQAFTEAEKTFSIPRR